MSGGHWNYDAYRVTNHMDTIAADTAVKQRWPRMAKLMSALSRWFYTVDHEMDWDLSDDSSIENDQKWEQKQLDHLVKIATRSSRARFKTPSRSRQKHGIRRDIS